MFNILYCCTIVSLLREGTLQNRYCKALPGSIVAHASSSQFLGSLLSGDNAQVLRVAVAEVTIFLLFHLDRTFGQPGALTCC